MQNQTRYILATVYRSAHGDCTMNGITSRFDSVFVPAENGNFTQQDVDNSDYPALEVIPPAFSGCPPRFKEQGDDRCLMAGGNFVYTSDSRFTREYGHGPVSVHDRFEG